MEFKSVIKTDVFFSAFFLLSWLLDLTDTSNKNIFLLISLFRFEILIFWKMIPTENTKLRRLSEFFFRVKEYSKFRKKKKFLISLSFREILD